MTSAAEGAAAATRRPWAWAFFAAVLGLAATVRWYRLGPTVLDGFDVWTYLRLSSEWLRHGIRPEEAFAKPGFILLGAAAGQVFGLSDATLPFLNALLDVANAALLFGVARLAGLGFPAACVAMFLYACLPAAVLEARNGLAHPASVTFVLSSFALLLIRTRLPAGRIAARYAVVAGAGLLGGYAGLIHPTVLLWTLALPLPLVLFHLARRDPPAFWTEDLLLYGLSAAVPFAGFAWLVKSETDVWPKALSLWRSIFGHGREAAYMKAGFDLSPAKLWHYGADQFYAHVLTPALFWTFAALAVLAALAWLRLRRRGANGRTALLTLFPGPLALLSVAGLCLGVFVVLVARVNGFEQWFMGDRFFLPLAPFTLLLGAALFQAAGRGLPPAGRIGLAVLVCGVSLASFWALFPRALYERPPFYKALRDAFQEQGITVDAGHKVLVFPDAGRHPMAVDHYFHASDFLTAGLPANEAALSAFLAENHVRYVLFSPVAYLGLSSPEGRPARLASEDPGVMAGLAGQTAFFVRYLEGRRIAPRLCAGQDWPPREPILRPVRLYAIGNHDYAAHLGNPNSRDNAFCLFDLEAAP